MKVTLFMAISLNGIIAGENNEEDFLSYENWLTLIELTQKTGCIIWGRKTHEIVRAWEKEYVDSIKQAKRVIVTTNPNYPVEEGCSIATSPEQALNMLETQGFDEVLLLGGGILNSAFMEVGLINEIVMNIEPALLGRGIPVFAPANFQKKLILESHQKLNDSIIQLRYRVEN